MHYDSLRSSLGLMGQWTHELGRGSSLASSLQLGWERELLDSDLVQKATFAGHDDREFDSRNRITGRDNLSLRAGLEYEAANSLVVGAHVASQLLRSGYQSLAGELSFRWRF